MKIFQVNFKKLPLYKNKLLKDCSQDKSCQKLFPILENNFNNFKYVFSLKSLNRNVGEIREKR